MENFYVALEPYFAADYQLLLDFIYMCPEADYVALIQKIPSFLSLNWLPFHFHLPDLKNYVRL